MNTNKATNRMRNTCGASGANREYVSAGADGDNLNLATVLATPNNALSVLYVRHDTTDGVVCCAAVVEHK